MLSLVSARDRSEQITSIHRDKVDDKNRSDD